MPEGDTVWRQARQLDAALAGHRLLSSDLRVPRYATTDLSGALVTACRARGKHLLIEVQPEASELRLIHSHLKMEGIWHLYPRAGAGSRWRRPAHTARAVFTVPETVAVGFSLGILEVLSPAETEARLAFLGPDLLGPEWNPAEAVRRLSRQPERPLGQALLDQRNLAGIGNIYRNELCFLARLHPAVPVAEARLRHLVDQAHRLLEANKGRSRRSTTGLAASNPDAGVWVYGREHRPCHRCGTRICKDDEEGRPIYFCPRCQRGPGSAR